MRQFVRIMLAAAVGAMLVAGATTALLMSTSSADVPATPPGTHPEAPAR